MNKFTPDEKTVKIMANFANINPSMVIDPDKLSVMSTSKTVIAKYPFSSPYSFNSFGFYDTGDVLSIINAMSKPEIEVTNDTFITIIGTNDDKVRYFTTAKELLPVVPNIDTSTSDFTVNLKCSITADKLAVINKMASILKSKYIFFETDGKKIRITLGDALESSGNNYEVFITDGIKENSLTEPIKIPVIDFKILPGEYEFTITSKIIPKSGKLRTFTVWENLNGVSYIITTASK